MDPKINNDTEPKIEEVHKEGFNKTPLLVAILVIVTGALLIFSFTSRNGGNLPIISQNEEQSVGPSLSFGEQKAASTAASAQIDVLVDSAGEKVNGVQIEFSYNPEELTVTDIIPGDFIPGAQVLLKKIDKEAGFVQFALATQLGDDAVSGSGTAATVIFAKTTEGESELLFGEGSVITQPGSDESILFETSSGTVTSTVPTSQ